MEGLRYIAYRTGMQRLVVSTEVMLQIRTSCASLATENCFMATPHHDKVLQVGAHTIMLHLTRLIDITLTTQRTLRKI